MALHRIMRRGQPYGAPIDDSYDPDKLQVAQEAQNGEQRGLHFLCFGANLSRQFEFVQANWALSPTFAGLSTDPGPLLGASRVRPFPAADFTMPGCPTRRIDGVPRVTEGRGAAYFFMQSRAALEYLGSSGGTRPPAR